MNESTLKPSRNRTAVFGSIAIFCSCVAPSLWLYALHIILRDVLAWGMILAISQGQDDCGVRNAQLGALIFWLLALVFGVTGLVRAERPRWPAIVALVLWCITPLLGCLFSYGYRALGRG